MMATERADWSEIDWTTEADLATYYVSPWLSPEFVERRVTHSRFRQLPHNREDELGLQEQLGVMERPFDPWDPRSKVLGAIQALIESANAIIPLSEMEESPYQTLSDVMRSVVEVKAGELLAYRLITDEQKRKERIQDIKPTLSIAMDLISKAKILGDGKKDRLVI